MNLLESAGFSRSNPYYIVKQGKVCLTFFADLKYSLKLFYYIETVLLHIVYTLSCVSGYYY